MTAGDTQGGDPHRHDFPTKDGRRGCNADQSSQAERKMSTSFRAKGACLHAPTLSPTRIGYDGIICAA